MFISHISDLLMEPRTDRTIIIHKKWWIYWMHTESLNVERYNRKSNERNGGKRQNERENKKTALNHGLYASKHKRRPIAIDSSSSSFFRKIQFLQLHKSTWWRWETHVYTWRKTTVTFITHTVCFFVGVDIYKTKIGFARQLWPTHTLSVNNTNCGDMYICINIISAHKARAQNIMKICTLSV